MQTRLKVYFSAHFEELENKFLDLLGADKIGPFETRDVLIPKNPVKNRLDKKIAERFGVSSNIRFSYLAPWILQRISEAEKKAASAGRKLSASNVFVKDQVAAETLTWKVFRLLKDEAFLSAPGNEPLKNYCSDLSDKIIFDFSTRLADLFERYYTFRIDWLQSWSANQIPHVLKNDARSELLNDEDAVWQSNLWRAMFPEIKEAFAHPGDVILNAAPEDLVGDPVYIFVQEYIPPMYLELLGRIAQSRDCHLFVLNPSENVDWPSTAFVTDKVFHRLQLKGQDEHVKVINSLLSSWGGQMRLLLGELDEIGVREHAEYLPVECAGDTLLHQIQSTMVEFREMENLTCNNLRIDGKWDIGDRSLEIHKAHSTFREIECLHDYLQECFRTMPNLTAADILVVTPDLDVVAPYIDAVFRSKPKEQFIEYRVEGLPSSSINESAALMFRAVDFLSSKALNSAFYELLSNEILRAKLELEAKEAVEFAEALENAGYRWGLNPDHSRKLVPNCDNPNNLRRSMRKLYLGFSLSDRDQTASFRGIAAMGGLEGNEAVALGKVDDLVRSLEEAASSMTSGTWQQFFTWFTRLMLKLLPEGAVYAEDRNELFSVLEEMGEEFESSACETEASFEVFIEALRARFAAKRRGVSGSGAVTFTQISMVRGLPYKVICLVGMNDRLFPKPVNADEFDLIDKHSRKGDISRLMVNRDTMLQLLMAARERFYVSYCAWDDESNQEAAPSIFISQLSDAVSKGLQNAFVTINSNEAALAEDKLESPKEFFTVAHPLQPFSLSAFDAADPRRLNHASYFRDALIRKLTEGETDLRSLEAELPVEEFPEVVSFDELVKFVKKPMTYVLRHRLGITLYDDPKDVKDSESFDAASLDRSLKSKICDRMVFSRPSAGLAEDIAALDVFPKAGPYEYKSREEINSVRNFVEAKKQLINAPLRSIPISIELDYLGKAVRIEGRIGSCYGNTVLLERNKRKSAPDDAVLNLHHLVLAATELDDQVKILSLVKEDSSSITEKAEVSAKLAEDCLTTLIALYMEGLRRPIRATPQSAQALAEALKDPDKAYRYDRAVDEQRDREDFKFIFPHPEDIELTDDEAFANALFF